MFSFVSYRNLCSKLFPNTFKNPCLKDHKISLSYILCLSIARLSHMKTVNEPFICNIINIEIFLNTIGWTVNTYFIYCPPNRISKTTERLFANAFYPFCSLTLLLCSAYFPVINIYFITATSTDITFLSLKIILFVQHPFFYPLSSKRTFIVLR